MKKLKLLFSVGLLFYTNCAFALLPKTACHSVCVTKKTTLAPGEHCTVINNQLMFYKLAGQGKITMIFSNGTGTPSSLWYQSKLATIAEKHVRTLTYDRLYTFNSCPNKNNYMPNTALDVVHRLHRLLQQQRINPPYILVGHSFGGLYMLLYARLYPKEVAGLLLLDPTSSAGPTPLPQAALPILRHLGNPQNPTPTNPLYNELIGQFPSYLQMRQAPPLSRKIPLIVMYATKHCLPTAASHTPLCMTKQEEHNHFLEQKEITNMSDIHEMIPVEGGHNSFFDEEKRKKVAGAIQRIITMSQTRANELTNALK